MQVFLNYISYIVVHKMIFSFALKNLLSYFVFMVSFSDSLMVTFSVVKKILRMIGLVLTLIRERFGDFTTLRRFSESSFLGLFNY